MPYRVMIDRVRELCVPGRVDEARAGVLKRHAALVEQRDDHMRDELAEGCPTALDAMAMVQRGEACDPRWSFQLVYGVELLCRYWGWLEKNAAFSPTRWDALEELSGALAKRMRPEPLSLLLYRGSPVEIAVPLPDIPAVGYLRAEEIKDHLARFPGSDALPRAERAAVDQLRSWLANCVATYERDLVVFTY